MDCAVVFHESERKDGVFFWYGTKLSPVLLSNVIPWPNIRYVAIDIEHVQVLHES